MGDMYNDRWAIGEDWDEHRARGSLGGTDFLVGVGTPIPAPRAGTVDNIPYYGTGGHTCRFWVSDNAYFEFMHLSEFVAEGSYSAGEIIGYSGGRAGADGSGSSTGPHIHMHAVIDGVRYRYSVLMISGASSGSKPFDNNEDKDDEMKNSGFYYRLPNNQWRVIVANTGSGFFMEIDHSTEMNVPFNNAIAATFGTGNFALINQSIRDNLFNRCEQVRQGK